MKRITLMLFFLVALGEIFAGIIHAEILHFICKPLIMILLVAYYLFAAQHHRSMIVIAAMLFSLVGDVLLMLEPTLNSLFMFGLLSFMIAHGCYILAYRNHQVETAASALQGIQKIRLALPVVLAGTGLIVVLYPVLGALRFPVVLYALVLVVMVLNALFRYGRTGSESFWCVFGGSLLFMLSDSILAVNKFLKPVEMADLLIMSTYISAQYFIVRGLASHLDLEEN